MPSYKPYREIHPDNWWLTASPFIAQAQEKARAGHLEEKQEYIRQWILREIIESYHYPVSWLGTRITAPSHNDIGLRDANVCSLCLTTQSGEPFLWILAAPPGCASVAEDALKAILTDDKYAGAGVCTDGTKEGTRFIQRRFDSDKCNYIPDLDLYSNPNGRPGPQPLMRLNVQEANAGFDERFRTLALLSVRVEDLFFEAHSHIRDIDGLHADEALDELCKVLYVKLYDEETTAHNQAYRMQRWTYGSVEELATTVRSLYAHANAYDTRVFSLKIPGYARSRGVFNSPIRLSSAAVAKLVDALQDYDLGHSSTDVKGRAFQKVLRPSIRAGMGQYFTPDPIVKFMVSVSNPDVTALVLDPFCGSAHMLTTCLQHVRQHAHAIEDKPWFEFAFGKLHGIEKSDRMVRIAMTDMRLHGDGHSNIRCTDALLHLSNYPDLQPESFDLIVTNPPFGSLLGEAALARLGAFDLTQGRKSVPLEVLGLERCVQFLRPGGRLAIVLPDGILANRSTTYVRHWLDSMVKLRAIISLPLATFAPFGANVKTSILFARKWCAGEQRDRDYAVLLARVDNVGYDASGRSCEGAELDAVIAQTRNFFEREGW